MNIEKRKNKQFMHENAFVGKNFVIFKKIYTTSCIEILFNNTCRMANSTPKKIRTSTFAAIFFRFKTGEMILGAAGSARGLVSVTRNV